MYFKKALVKDYGEQVWRDAKAQNRSYEQVSYGSAWVVRACQFIPDTDKAEENFRKAIVKYATENKKPKNFY